MEALEGAWDRLAARRPSASAAPMIRTRDWPLQEFDSPVRRPGQLLKICRGIFYFSKS